MTRRLVVVESPNKIAKVSKCLGPGFVVVATVGHFRDLPEGNLGVDVSTFTPHYETLPDKTAVVSKLREAARGATEVLLGTDADREGEAIAWHVAEVLGISSAKRIRFQELTPAALTKAVATAGPIDKHLVDAQQARRVLDRLVGYQVSPLLSVFGPHHSAGRVQSAALHLVVEREKARELFKPEGYWTVTASYSLGFTAQAAQQDAKGGWIVARFRQQHEAEQAVEKAKAAASHRVESLETKAADRQPQPPFTTSTLQQAASAQLGMKPADTMAVAQSLFEKGAITYHRTDSVALSEEAVSMARGFLSRDYPEALPEKAVAYRNSESAQEAHEAIRPTNLKLDADVTLNQAEDSLFNLIKRRFLACQCRPARFDITVARIAAGEVRFLAKGRVVRFQSFLRYLAEDEVTAAAKHEGVEEDAPLPCLVADQQLAAASVTSKGEKTKPLPRFTQATLIRELQRTGIGRPSTFASTVTLLFERRYLMEEKKAVAPTPRGRLIDGALSAAFPEVVAADTTAQLESQLDGVAAGKVRWKTALKQWHDGFALKLEAAPQGLRMFSTANPELVDAAGDAPKSTGKKCPCCSMELLLRQGSKGAFLSCSG